jgi:hypothetical protein
MPSIQFEQLFPDKVFGEIIWSYSEARKMVEPEEIIIPEGKLPIIRCPTELKSFQNPHDHRKQDSSTN